MKFISLGYSAKKQWGPFIMHVRDTFYESLMTKHDDWNNVEDFDLIVEYLARCPKTKRMATALDSLTNAGLVAKEIIELNYTTAREVEKATDYSIRFGNDYRRWGKKLNKFYYPPKLKNIIDDKKPDNNFVFSKDYVWADHLTFPSLSSIHSYYCCISNGGYEDGIVDVIASIRNVSPLAKGQKLITLQISKVNSF